MLFDADYFEAVNRYTKSTGIAWEWLLHASTQIIYQAIELDPTLADRQGHAFDLYADIITARAAKLAEEFPGINKILLKNQARKGTPYHE